jgi:asparagine synthase (glutamine-hydrolysing)
MCGINGFNWKDESLVRRMNSYVKHRGPDDKGQYTDEHVSLAQVRLSIIDLSPAGHNPMFYSRKKGAFSERHHSELMGTEELAIVFNGEIYNFQELRDGLEKKGYAFSTRSDTEVILAAYMEWGYDCLSHFNGMWAFVIYDKRKGLLFCSRDRLGVKPFYYYYNESNKKFIFSSEMKGILSHSGLAINSESNIDRDAFQLYFAFGFVPSPHSIFKDVFKLEAGHYLVFDLKRRKIRITRYYEVPGYAPIRSRKNLIAEGREILKDAVRIRMIADVPVGAFLSGGLDSSTVVGVMREYTDLKKLHTFSIGFEGEYDESRYAKLVKEYFGTRHHHIYFHEKDFESLIGKYAFIYDEPFADYSGFPTYTVSKLARQHVTVALSGDGGDEIFGGYNSHLAARRMDFLYNLPGFVKKIGSGLPAKKNLNSFVSPYLLANAFKLSMRKKEHFFAEALADDLYKPEIYKELTRKRLRYALKKGGDHLSEALRLYDLGFNTLQDNFLVKVDRASMANGLEVRSPFLDYRFVEFSQKIPAEYKVSMGKTKVLMRQLIHGIVPDEIRKRGKQGFTPPMDKWILKPKYINEMKNNLDVLKDEELLRFYVEKVFKEENKLYNLYKIRLFLYLKWHQRWVMKDV